MFEKITVIDVETADNLQTRICSIGITRIENGVITGTENHLINPECDFSAANTAKHGIKAENVQGKPTFREFWESNKDLFYDGIVSGYYLSFDLNVLRKTMKAYEIEARPFRYFDIAKLVKELCLNVPDTKLPTICNAFQVGLMHHNSGSDSRAAAEIYLKIQGNFTPAMLDGFVNVFDVNATIKAHEDYRQREAINLSPVTRALRALKATIEDLTKDGTITLDDFMALLDSIEKYCFGLYGRYPFDEIIAKINGIVADGEVTQDELEDFTNFCKMAFNPVESSESAFDGVLSGKHIVLTGDFAVASRKDLEKRLKAEYGAIVQSGVTGETNMVIVGKLGSKAWAMGTYGNKVERAKQLQGRGYNILILKEEEVF